MSAIVYDTALQAIAVAQYVQRRQGLNIGQASQFCQDTKENRDVLQIEAKEIWDMEGVTFFRTVVHPSEEGCGWIVKIKKSSGVQNPEKDIEAERKMIARWFKCKETVKVRAMQWDGSVEGVVDIMDNFPDLIALAESGKGKRLIESFQIATLATTAVVKPMDWVVELDGFGYASMTPEEFNKAYEIHDR
jgi:hypothetical protein